MEKSARTLAPALLSLSVALVVLWPARPSRAQFPGTPAPDGPVERELPEGTMLFDIAAHDELRQRLEKLAAEMPYLDIDAILFRRQSRVFFGTKGSNIPTHHDRVLRSLRLRGRDADEYPREALLELLHHPQPKVRTLAMCALFDAEDVSLLPAIAALMDDNAATFDGLDSLYRPRVEYQEPRRKAQTVGLVARRMIALYLRYADAPEGMQRDSEAHFEMYWKLQENRPWSVSRFAVQLARSALTMPPAPMPPDAAFALRMLRERLQKLPVTERLWVLLWLNGESGARVLTNEAKLLELAREVGPDKLLLMLQGRTPTEEPELRPRGMNNYRYENMMNWVLQHATELLRPDQAETLLVQATVKPANDLAASPWFSIGAAELQPAQARTWLHEAWARYGDKRQWYQRVHLAAALLRLVAAKPNVQPEVWAAELKFIVDWFYGFYTETAGADRFSSDRFGGLPSHFLQEIASAPQPVLQPLIKAIVLDPRLEQAPAPTTSRLVMMVNNWLPAPIAGSGMRRQIDYRFRDNEGFPREEDIKKWQEEMRAAAQGWN